jgi:hypothetical protein
MRIRHGLLVPIVLTLVVGCAAPPPPKIEGRVSTVSASDIQEIIELVQRNTKRGFTIIPIQRIEVRDHNHVVVYSQDEFENHIISVTREHGAWSFPRVTITG